MVLMVLCDLVHAHLKWIKFESLHAIYEFPHLKDFDGSF